MKTFDFRNNSFRLPFSCVSYLGCYQGKGFGLVEFSTDILALRGFVRFVLDCRTNGIVSFDDFIENYPALVSCNEVGDFMRFFYKRYPAFKASFISTDVCLKLVVMLSRYFNNSVDLPSDVDTWYYFGIISAFYTEFNL